MGLADRIIRPALAMVLIELCATKKVSGVVCGALVGLSAVFILTSMFGSCPAYTGLGISSKSQREEWEGIVL